MSMWYEQDELWVGDKLGLVHLIDATDGDFNVVEVRETLMPPHYKEMCGGNAMTSV